MTGGMAMAQDRPRRRDIDLVVFDFDGVMTDNTVYVFDDGSEAVRCNRADGLGCDLLRAAGIPGVILSTETNAVVAARAAKLRLDVLHGLPDKQRSLLDLARARDVDAARILYVGNDVNDLAAMRWVGWPVAPADAHPAVIAIARYVTAARGGQGVVREVADLLLDGRGAS